LRSRPRPAGTPGLRYAEPMTGAPLRTGAVTLPTVGRVALIAAWDDDAALDRFTSAHPLATLLHPGWHVRLEPLRAWGSWSALPDLPTAERDVDDEPVAVLTLGRLRLLHARRFLAASGPAEREATTHPAVVAATGLARPPRLVATFSLWRTGREMREYAVGDAPGGHKRAIDAHRRRPFHHESVFARFRPYGASGSWDGRDPLAGANASRPVRPAPAA